MNNRHGQALGIPTYCVAISSCALLFLLSVFPMIYKVLYLKAFLFAVVLASIAVEYVTSGRSRLDFRLSVWTVGLSAMSFLFALEGMFRQAPGAGKVVVIYVVWPIVYTIWVAGLAQPRLLSAIDRTALVATLFLGVYGCAYLLTQLNILPETSIVSALSMDWEFDVFEAGKGYTSMTLAGVNSLPFLLPYVMARLATHIPAPGETRLKQIALWAASILCLVVSLASSRRALVFVVILTPLFVFILRSFQPKTERGSNRRSFLVFSLGFLVGIFAVFVALNTVYQFDLGSIWQRLSSAFDFGPLSSDESGGGMVRREQYFALMRGWLDHPLFGAGHGASAGPYGSIRSDLFPWSYELGYLALLFQIGLVGLVAYAAGVAWIFRRGIKLIRDGGPCGQMMIPMLAGLTGVLLCHAVDPYLDRFDCMWMLFLPLAVINYGFSRTSPEAVQSSPLAGTLRAPRIV